MSKPTKYVDVILPLPVKDYFTYSTNIDNIKIGQLVVVQFGNRKFYSAIVKSIHLNKPKKYEVKSIVTVLDDIPIVDSIQLKFWDWMANYYMCSLGDIMNAALPAYFRIASETQVVIHPQFDGELDDLTNDIDGVALRAWWRPDETGTAVPSISVGYDTLSISDVTTGFQEGNGYSVGLNWDDLFQASDTVGIAFGQPIKATDHTDGTTKDVDPFMWEVYYSFRPNDSIEVTPGIFGGSDVDADTADDIFGAVLTTTFKF